MVHLIIIAINGALSLITFASYFSVYFHPAHHTFLPLLGIVFPYLMCFHFLFLLYWVLRLKKYFLLSAVTLIVGWPWINNHLQFNSSYYEQKKNDWVVVSYNIHHNYDIQKLKKSGGWGDAVEDWNKFIKTYFRLDLMCIQENPKNKSLKLAGLDNLTFFHQCKARGPSIHSRHRIINSGCIDLGNTVNGVIYADIERVKGDVIRVYNVHLQSNQVSDMTQPFLNESEIRKGQNIEKSKQILGRFTQASQIRGSQVLEVLEHIEQSPYPTIVAGDFNEGPQSFVYQKMNRKLKDSYVQKGLGVSSTYAGNLPLLRIDHIFHDDSWQTEHYQVGEVPFSDHYPVAVSLRRKSEL